MRRGVWAVYGGTTTRAFIKIISHLTEFPVGYVLISRNPTVLIVWYIWVSQTDSHWTDW